MSPELIEAYQLVVADLDRRSKAAQRLGSPRRYIQSVENARAVLVREAELDES